MNSSIFKKLSRRLRSPRQVQEYLREIPYNKEEEGETQRSALAALIRGRIHCLEATLVAAAILEHSGYPPLVMSLESKDDLDHVVFIFKERTGWGAVGRSRMEGLHGRRPIYRSVRDLAYSYFDPFIDETGRIIGYGVANLDDSKSPWRAGPKNVWKVVNHLIALKHKKIRSSNRRYQRWYRYFKRTGQSGVRTRTWW